MRMVVMTSHLFHYPPSFYLHPFLFPAMIWCIHLDVPRSNGTMPMRWIYPPKGSTHPVQMCTGGFNGHNSKIPHKEFITGPLLTVRSMMRSMPDRNFLLVS